MAKPNIGDLIPVGAIGTAKAPQVLSGFTFSGDEGVGLAGSMPNRGSVTNTITTQGGQYTIPSGYHSGAGKVTASFSNLSAGNIKNGVSIGGVNGSYRGPTLSGNLIEYSRENFRLDKDSTRTFYVSPNIQNYYALYVETYHRGSFASGGNYYRNNRVYFNTSYQSIRRDSNSPSISLSGNTFTITAESSGEHDVTISYYT